MPLGRVCENVEDFLDTCFLSLICLLQLGAIAIHCRTLEAYLSHVKLWTIWPQSLWQRGLRLTWKCYRGLVLIQNIEIEKLQRLRWEGHRGVDNSSSRKSSSGSFFFKLQLHQQQHNIFIDINNNRIALDRHPQTLSMTYPVSSGCSQKYYSMLNDIHHDNVAEHRNKNWQKTSRINWWSLMWYFDLTS